MGFCHPILIPYFDEDGELQALRPHKDNLPGAVARLYLARPPGEVLSGRDKGGPKWGCITEGEFKGAALWQVLGDDLLVACMPGITFAKMLLWDVIEWASPLGVPGLVVTVYDNEEKGQRNLPDGMAHPAYIKDKWKRYESVAWGRVLAKLLAVEGLDARVGKLPDEWRDGKGKADWDGALASLGRKLQVPSAKFQGKSPEEIWAMVRGQIEPSFRKVLMTAPRVSGSWQAGLFDDDVEREICKRVDRLSYTPKLPVGDEASTKLGKRLQRYARKAKGRQGLTEKQRLFVYALGKIYQTLERGYYSFRPLSEKKAEEWEQVRNEAVERKDLEARRICEVVQEGLPQMVTNFFIRWHYLLNRSDGARVRLVSLHSVHGDYTRDMRVLPTECMSQPVRLREWTKQQGNFSWGIGKAAGQQEFDKLMADSDHALYGREVIEVGLRGYDERSELWFYDDVAYDLKGNQILPKKGIYWVRGEGWSQGYKFAQNQKDRMVDQEGQTFRQETPRMHPEVKSLTTPAVGALLREIGQKLLETIGTYEAYIGLGMTSVCFASPEIYKQWNQFPGLWTHGEPGQGKSSIVRWLCRFHGLTMEKGILLPESSSPGIAIAAQQYGASPLWLDEYQPEKIPMGVMETIKAMFGKESGSKVRTENVDREKRAVCFVSGVGTSHDAQVKSRFAHIQVSETKRRRDEAGSVINHYDWFQEHSSRFYLIGRWLLENRPKYVAAVQEYLKSWLAAPELQRVEERTRRVHGMAYAGFMALVQLLEGEWDGQAVMEYRRFLVKHCTEAEVELRQQVTVNQFWEKLLSAWTAGAFGRKPSELRSFFAWKEEKAISPEDAPNQTQKPWRRAWLYLKPSAVIDVVSKSCQQCGQNLVFNRTDLGKQMSTKPYWVQPNGKDEEHRFQFVKGKGRERAWRLFVERIPGIGYVPCSDDDFKASLYPNGEGENGPLEIGDWADPRCGDLYVLGNLLNQKDE